ncbi:two-component system histidine kinase PnpS [Sporolactobacillus kofuensis]|uniref:histidine kinase n=1 Tax=Sporolactobacillus kofuensis TaxID=269672 RepID=A0ABW1W9T4_9BACL|nr:ATP-binding protein [Sporolactobacillus kofuensis]MCO7175953.1 ATP-binding protein [Sporolactobacillus kofuensis]
MKNQRLDRKIWMRWGFVIAGLFFVVFVSNEVIQIALLHQDQQMMDERKNWIESFVVRDGRLQIDRENAGLIHFSKKGDVKVTIYNRERQLLYDSTGMQNTKLHQSIGIHQVNDHLRYIAPLQADQKTVGYVQIEGKKTVIIGLSLIYFFIIIGGIALLLYRDYLVRSYAKPIRFASRMAENLLEGSYNMIASDHVKRESVLRLNLAMNRVSDAMHELSRSYRRQQDSMSTLIENIGNGLIFVDGSGRINYVNQTFKDDFHTPAAHWELADYHEVIPYENVRQMIDEVFDSKKKLAQQLHLTVGIERKHFDVSCAPIINKHHRVRGIVVVFHDITEIKKLENTRRDFVANVSHELKTPVTSLIGFTETLLDGARDDKDLEEQFLQIMLHEGQRLQSLITDLLELSKIEREHFELHWVQVSLRELLDNVLLIFKEKVTTKNIKIVRKNGSDGIVLGDAFRIRQIMINLITNAIAYTPENGTVTLSIQEHEQDVQLIISDTGIGIEAEQIPRIFERFYRVDKARSRDSGGTGLGLAIVKHLVEAHGGTIHVTSTPGKGSTFTITFLKSPPMIG